MPAETGPGDTPEIELAVPISTVCLVIAKAREFGVKDESSDDDPSVMDEDDLRAAALEDRPSDPVEEELRVMISDLPEDAQVDLVALMWLGRDDGSEEDWEEIRATAADEHNDFTAEYLCGTPLLADHLAAGLAALGRDCRDVFRGHM